MNYELTEICANKISEYLGFNMSKIFKTGDYIAIFGGAVRDSLADKEIHDIDILCLPESALSLSKFLTDDGFIKVDLYDKVTLEMYNSIHCISEPWTFIKDSKIIQIIKPADGKLVNGNTTIGSLLDAYYALLSDVDISACGVFIERDRDGIAKLKESHLHAITHCRSSVFEILRNNRMFGGTRTEHRKFKLETRGWKDISNSDDIKDERRVKLMGLPTHGLQQPAYPYKSYKRTEDKIVKKYSSSRIYDF